MTKMHFEEAARIVRVVMANDPPAERLIVAHAYAQLFKSFNPRFDRARFMAACEVPE